ncbi:hypothetical protein TWF696_009662 [Orbilia brochopaga]|uniref:C2H2-type domain-containing protein n=1 Tax=Orbilia brochopaga TaxID=3140254 RepID=A0AAV9UDF8_9PEZI
MCLYDVNVFHDCQCAVIGALRETCPDGEAKGGPCGQTHSGRLQMIWNPGKCERCKVGDATEQRQVEAGEQLADRPAREEVSSVFLSVYEAIRVKRRLMRSRPPVKPVKGDTEASEVQARTEPQNSSDGDFSMFSTPENALDLFPGMTEIDISDILNSNSSNPLQYPWPPQDHSPLQSSEMRHQYQGGNISLFPSGSQGSELQPTFAHHAAGVDLMPLALQNLPGEKAADAGEQVDTDKDMLSSSSDYLSGPCSNQITSDEVDSLYPTFLQESAYSLDFETVSVQGKSDDLRTCKTNVRGFRNGLQMHEGTEKPDAGSSTSQSDLHPSRLRLYQTNEKFLSSATKAHDKLKRAAYSITVSDDFRRFYKDLGGFKEILQAGFEALEKFLEGGIPRSLKEMYSFLHIAYAMSQAELVDVPALGDSEFATGISIFKHCLLDEPATGSQISEQDLFEEIVKIMWDELRDGLAWIKGQDAFGNLQMVTGPGLQPYDMLKWSFDQNTGNMGSTSLNAPAVDFSTFPPRDMTMELDMLEAAQERSPATAPNWDDLFSSKGFGYVVHFLKSLNDIGTVFLYLCGTLYSAISTTTATKSYFSQELDPEKRKPPASCPPINPVELEMRDHIQELVINPLRKDDAGSQIAKVAKYMLRAVPMSDFLDFESYLLGLIKVRSRPKHEFVRLVQLVLSLCQRCYYSLSEQCKLSYPVQFFNPDQDLEFKTTREECWYSMEEDGGSNIFTPAVPATDSPSQLDISNLNLANDVTLDGFRCYSDQEYTSPSAFSTSSRCSAYSMPPPSRKRASFVGKKPGVQQTKKRRIDPEKKPYACEVPGCRHRDTTESNLKRHHTAEHGDESVKTMVCRCDFKGCTAQRTGARALENIKTHKKEKHGIGGRRGKGTSAEV